MSKKAKTSDWSRKPSHKGQKCIRGVPLMHDEVKQKVTLCLTPTALTRLQELSNELKYSRSEVIEQWLRGSFSLSLTELGASNTCMELPEGTLPLRDPKKNNIS